MKKYLTIIFLSFISFTIFCQERTLQGVLADDGDPLLFASVAVYRQGVLIRGVETDLDGNYSVECMVGDEIRSTYIGYNPKSFIVTEAMLNNKVRTEKLVISPVTSDAYARSLTNRKEKWNSQKKLDIFNDSKRLKIEGRNHLYKSRAIVESDDKLKFVGLKKSIRYNLDIKQTVGASIIQNSNLHGLQTQFAQGLPKEGSNIKSDYDRNTPFSWGEKLNKPSTDHNLVTPSIFYTTQVKADVVYGDKRYFLTMTHDRQADIFNVGDQKSTKGKVGFMKYTNKNVMLAELSFGQTSMANHNAGGFYQNVLKSMMVQSPSFNSFQNIDGEYSSYHSDFNNPSWLLDNNSNAIQSRNIGLFIQHKNRNRHYSTNYSNALKIEMDYINVNDRSAYGTIGDVNGRNRQLRYYYPKINLISNLNKYISQSKGTTEFILNNHLEAEYLRFMSSENSQDEFNGSLLRSSPQMGIKSEGSKINYSVTYNPIFSSLQATDWTSFVTNMSYKFKMDKKYLDEVNLIAGANRSAKKQELFLSRNNYSAQVQDSHEGLGSDYDIPLFLPVDLKNEVSQSGKIGISLLNKYRSNRWYTSVTYRSIRQTDVIFPIFTDGTFLLSNVGNFNTHALEWKSDVKLYHKATKLEYEGAISIVKYNTKVTKENLPDEKVIISGFSNVSKQFVLDEPIGVIVGSDYQRNEIGQLIIDSEGYPMRVDEDLIIGDPTPLFVGHMQHTLNRGNITLAIDIDGQFGGQTWNGTQQALDYYGVSQVTAEERDREDYIFDGVDANGDINTQKISLVDPSRGITGNRWTRYGLEGIASDYIVDASYLRLRKITLGYKKILPNRKEVQINIFATNLLTLAPYQGFTTNYLFGDDLSSGLQYFNQPMTTQIGISTHFKI